MHNIVPPYYFKLMVQPLCFLNLCYLPIYHLHSDRFDAVTSLYRGPTHQIKTLLPPNSTVFTTQAGNLLASILSFIFQPD